MGAMSNLDVAAQEAAIKSAREFTLCTLATMKSMIDCLPDGQWEDGPYDILIEIKEEKPGPLDEIWLEYKAELETNMAYWV